jgi:hypothetical protein
MKARNEIAHGPVVLHYGNGDAAPPTAVGLLKVRGELVAERKIIPLDEIKQLVDLARQGAVLLDGFLKDILARRPTPED